MKYGDDTRYFEERAKYKIKCKCSHTVVIPPFKDKVLCSYCGRYVFRNKKDEFMFRLKSIKR